MRKVAALCALLLLTTGAAHAVPSTYTSEAAFLADLAAAGLTLIQEGFEDDAAWGDVRSSVGGFNTAPSVTHLGITWWPNDPASGVTTGSGAARTGLYGVYVYPHAVLVGDGWTCTGEGQLYAAGGWIRTNTPPAEVAIVLDDSLRVGDNWVISGPHVFLGVIDPDGFGSVRFRDFEAAGDEGKYIFGDDFSFGVSASTAAPPAELAGAPRLLGNHPNPFNPSTRLELALPVAGEASLAIYDARGRRLRSLLAGPQPAGLRRVDWDGRDDTGHPLPAGVYLARLVAPGGESTRRLVLLK